MKPHNIYLGKTSWKQTFSAALNANRQRIETQIGLALESDDPHRMYKAAVIKRILSNKELHGPSVLELLAIESTLDILQKLAQLKMYFGSQWISGYSFTLVPVGYDLFGLEAMWVSNDAPMQHVVLLWDAHQACLPQCACDQIAVCGDIGSVPIMLTQRGIETFAKNGIN